MLVVADGDPSGVPGLKRGGCEVAIAGGVNVIIHPNKYLMLERGADACRSDGRCQSFGEGGDGYMPGEGVGVVVLKRLSRGGSGRRPHLWR